MVVEEYSYFYSILSSFTYFLQSKPNEVSFPKFYNKWWTWYTKKLQKGKPSASALCLYIFYFQEGLINNLYWQDSSSLVISVQVIYWWASMLFKPSKLVREKQRTNFIHNPLERHAYA